MNPPLERGTAVRVQNRTGDKALEHIDGRAGYVRGWYWFVSAWRYTVAVDGRDYDLSEQEITAI